MNFLSDSNHVIQNLYREAYRTPVAEFKMKAFNLLADHLQIDSGTWVTRTEQRVPFYEQDSFTYQLPEGFMEHYHELSTVSTQVHQVFGVMLGNLGKTMDILDVVPEEEWFGSDMYQLYCQEYNLHHSLMTVLVNPVNQVMNLITVARHDPDRAFDVREKQIKEFLVPNLIEALRINILNSFSQENGNQEAYRGVFDRYGNVIEAEEGFLNLLNQKDLIVDGKLKVNLQSDLTDCQLGEITLNFQNHNGLVYAELSTLPLHERLSRRKLDICNLLAQGQSNKEIALKLSISPNTVNNHLKEVFKALQVNSRQQAIAYLIRQKEG